jgi:acetyl-CoA decarbonylase/synthase complex subunit gamma
MRYSVPPGLYAVGDVDETSPVLVTANYKLSFDHLRTSLPGRPFWLLVLDTAGINVWCAAGKGTFGTEELVRRIEGCGLAERVSHRKLILPQLGAPGVSAHEVKKRTGFRVVYGPVLSRDLPAFFEAGMKATEEMRRKTFTLAERAVLIPVELVGTLKFAIPLTVAFFFLGGLRLTGTFEANLRSSGLLGAAAFVGALAGGTVLFPLLLPWLPGRAFSLKAVPLGLAVALSVILPLQGIPKTPGGILEFAAWLFLVTVLTSFLAMNFTGASTYTSLSGVRREMRTAVPLQIAGAVAGLLAWVGARFVA